MIRGRLTHINDHMVDPDSYEDDRAQRLASREFNLSQTATIPSDNRLVQGSWWKDNETEAVFSVEEGIAETLGIKLNDTLTYSIAGREVSGKVVNLRWVEWDSFNVNFFVVSNPGTLDNQPATYITSFFLPPENRQLLSELVRAFPSVTVFDLDSILTEVRKIMDQVTRAIEFVFVFTLMAGLIVLAAALQTTHDERIRESAVLFALGANRRQITLSLLAEFTCIGLIAGILAAFTATIAEIILAEFVFKMDIVINPWLWVAGPAACILIIVIAGLLGTRRVLSSPPLITLRQN
jgi:putative ABC transport system permease protein